MVDSSLETRHRITDLVKHLKDTSPIPNEALHRAYEVLSVLAEELYQADHQLQAGYEELLEVKQQVELERKRYQELFEFAFDPYLVTDMNAVIQETNRAVAQLLKVRTSYLVGKPLNLFVSREEWKRFFNLLHAGNDRFDLELTLKPRNQSTITAAVTLENVYNSIHDPIGLRWLLRDITDQKHTQDELSELHHRLQESSEVERLRLAQDLHDGPIQALYGSVFQLNLTNALLDNPDAQNSIREVETNIKQVASELRSICGELRPPTLANLGLERAIRSHAEKIQDHNPEMEIRIRLEPDALNITPDMRLSLFRIYQQCMANVLNHAHANQVEIRLLVGSSDLQLSVRDNGKGFTCPDKLLDLARQGHYGLAGVAERTESMHGHLVIETMPDKGTLVHVTVPRNKH